MLLVASKPRNGDLFTLFVMRNERKYNLSWDKQFSYALRITLQTYRFL